MVCVFPNTLIAPILQAAYSHDHGIVAVEKGRLFCPMKNRYISTSVKLAILGGGHFGQSILTEEKPAKTDRYDHIWQKNKAAEQKTGPGRATKYAPQASN